jgi:hypothetical protein
MKKLKLSLIVTTLGFSYSAFALNSMRAGLWENSNTIKSKSGQIEKALSALAKQLASLPEEERKILAQDGSSFTGPNPVGRSCVTKAMAEKMEIPKLDKNCEQTIVNQTSDYVKLKFTCSGQIPATGEGDFKLKDPKNYETKATTNTTINGKADVIYITSHGKWLSDDCGKVK